MDRTIIQDEEKAKKSDKQAMGKMVSIHEQMTAKLYDDGKALLKERIETNGIDCDLTWGYYHALPKPGRFDGLKAWKQEWDELGYTDTRLVPKSELEEVLETHAYHGALHDMVANTRSATVMGLLEEARLARFRGFKVAQKNGSMKTAFGQVKDWFVGNF